MARPRRRKERRSIVREERICNDHDKETALWNTAVVGFIEVGVEEGLAGSYAAMMVGRGPVGVRRARPRRQDETRPVALRAMVR